MSDAFTQGMLDATLKPGYRWANIRVVTMANVFDKPRDGVSVYVFDEDQTEQEVLDELWQEWVNYQREPDEDPPPAGPPTWDALANELGDYFIEHEERRVQVKVR